MYVYMLSKKEKGSHESSSESSFLPHSNNNFGDSSQIFSVCWVEITRFHFHSTPSLMVGVCKVETREARQRCERVNWIDSKEEHNKKVGLEQRQREIFTHLDTSAYNIAFMENGSMNLWQEQFLWKIENCRWHSTLLFACVSDRGCKT